MYDWMKKDETLFLAGGIVAGLLLPCIFKAKKTRELTVKGLAKGMMVKDSIMEEVNNMREEAEDICAEAKTLAKYKYDASVADEVDA